MNALGQGIFCMFLGLYSIIFASINRKVIRPIFSIFFSVVGVAIISLGFLLMNN